MLISSVKFVVRKDSSFPATLAYIYNEDQKPENGLYGGSALAVGQTWSPTRLTRFGDGLSVLCSDPASALSVVGCFIRHELNRWMNSAHSEYTSC